MTHIPHFSYPIPDEPPNGIVAKATTFAFFVQTGVHNFFYGLDFF
jgi:hypothetical protein